MKAFDSIGSYATGAIAGGKEAAIKALNEEFEKKANQLISAKITPFYNVCNLIFSGVFVYFAVTEENQCYAREQKAFAISYSDTVDVSYQFYLLCVAGVVLLMIGSLLYHL